MLVPIFFNSFDTISESLLNWMIFVIRQEWQLSLQPEAIKCDRHGVTIVALRALLANDRRGRVMPKRIALILAGCIPHFIAEPPHDLDGFADICIAQIGAHRRGDFQ